MDDKVAWKVHDYQVKHGNPRHPKPDAPRPPEIGQVWHNSFHDLVSGNAGEIGDLLAASAAVLAGAKSDGQWEEAAEILEIARRQDDIATSIPEAIRLTRRLGADQLGVPLNEPFGGKLAYVRTAS